MSYRKLFGQYYDSAKSKSQDVDYVCNSADDANSTSLSVNDDAVTITDGNGNTLQSLSLSSLLVKPVTQYALNTVVLNPQEVKFLAGLEYGASYMRQCFLLPDNIKGITNLMGWETYLSLEFDILYTVNLQLEDYHVKVSMPTEETPTALTARIDNILSDMGIPATAEWMTYDDKYCLVFTSSTAGYDFRVSDVKLNLLLTDDGYSGSPFDGIYEYFDEDGNPVEATYLVKDDEGNFLTDEEGNYIDELGDKVMRVLKFVISKDGMSPAELKIIEDAENDIKSIWDRINSMTTSYGTYDREALRSLAQLFHYDGEDEGSDEDDGLPEDIGFRIPGEWLPMNMPEDESMRLGAYKYPNGASRVWFIVPEWPDSEDDDAKKCIWLTHVKDEVDIYSETEDCEEGHYVKHRLPVVGMEKNEKERRNIRHFYVSENLDEYTDRYGTVIRKNVTKTEEDRCTCPDECPCKLLEAKDDHIGMYRFIDWASENDLWMKVGQFYSVIGPDDDPEDESKGFSRSLYLFNPNDYPVKVCYLTAV